MIYLKTFFVFYGFQMKHYILKNTKIWTEVIGQIFYDHLKTSCTMKFLKRNFDFRTQPTTFNEAFKTYTSSVENPKIQQDVWQGSLVFSTVLLAISLTTIYILFIAIKFVERLSYECTINYCLTPVLNRSLCEIAQTFCQHAASRLRV